MPKGRGANARRRNQSLSGRKGGGTQSGSRHAHGLAMAAVTADWRSGPGVWRLTPRGAVIAKRRGWWGRLIAWVTPRARAARPAMTRSTSTARPSPAPSALRRDRAGNPGERIVARRRV
jgi:hypothetical protein